MTKSIGCLAVLTAIFISTSAAACSFDRLPPAETLRTSTAAVIAAPLLITYCPADAASSKFVGSFVQTVTWRVSRRYKGKFRAGSTFSTSEKMNRNDLPCGISTEVHGKEERLIYLYGKTPPFRFFEVDLRQAGEDLKVLGTPR